MLPMSLAHLMGTWRSLVYGHFDALEIVFLLHGQIMHKFRCKQYVFPSLTLIDIVG